MTQDLRDPLIGRLVDGRYLVTHRVARGGMATVYRADDQRLDRTVALKVMHMHLADDEEFRQRFIQEAKVSARVQHPNAVSVFDQGTEGEVAYLVMEYVPSMTLRDYLIKHGSLTPKQSMQVTEAVLAGLAAAHRADLVHRDIKPENILLANDGRIKVGDFGLARASTANTATGKALLGTIAYLSPELVTRGQADKRSDIYAVGIMLFEMLTGKQPFTGDQPMQIAYQHANEQVPAPSSIEPGIPRSLDLIVEWATQRDPDMRPSDAGELLRHVHEVRGGAVREPQPTLLLSGGVDPDAATQALEVRQTAEVPVGLSPAEQAPAGAPAALARKTSARRRRGFVWLAGALVIAVLAAVAGWWFSLGPGGSVEAPDAVGQTFEAASLVIAEAGFERAPDREDAPDYDIPAGQVIDMRPPAGTSLPKDATITLIVSSGRQSFAAPDLAGLEGEQAQEAIEQAGFAFDEGLVDRRFADSAPRGTVIRGVHAVGEGDEREVLDFEPSQEIEERTPMGYVLSLGAVPGEAGQPVDEVRAALDDVGLAVEIVEEHTHEVEQGRVMQITMPEGVIREGATITLTVSLGPPLVTIPDVSDMSFREAVGQLRSLGFTVDPVTSVGVEALWGAFGVESVSPGIGESIPEGSTVTVTGEY